jgi:hypothetical protein
MSSSHWLSLLLLFGEAYQQYVTKGALWSLLEGSCLSSALGWVQATAVILSRQQLTKGLRAGIDDFPAHTTDGV